MGGELALAGLGIAYDVFSKKKEDKKAKKLERQREKEAKNEQRRLNQQEYESNKASAQQSSVLTGRGRGGSTLFGNQSGISRKRGGGV